MSGGRPRIQFCCRGRHRRMKILPMRGRPAAAQIFRDVLRKRPRK